MGRCNVCCACVRYRWTLFTASWTSGFSHRSTTSRQDSLTNAAPYIESMEPKYFAKLFIPVIKLKQFLSYWHHRCLRTHLRNVWKHAFTVLHSSMLQTVFINVSGTMWTRLYSVLSLCRILTKRNDKESNVILKVWWLRGELIHVRSEDRTDVQVRTNHHHLHGSSWLQITIAAGKTNEKLFKNLPLTKLQLTFSW